MPYSRLKVVALKAFGILLMVNSSAGRLLLICMRGNAKGGKVEKQGWFLSCERLLSFVIPGQN